MSEDMKVIVFQIKDKEYAIPVDKVSGIEKILTYYQSSKGCKVC